jgi:hypothetical protein
MPLKPRSPAKPRQTSKRKVCRAPRRGQKCQQCGRGKLDYNGLLQLVCPACGCVADAGVFS